eukprot:1141844-Pelagomonas_calceolata.AAC.7
MQGGEPGEDACGFVTKKLLYKRLGGLHASCMHVSVYRKGCKLGCALSMRETVCLRGCYAGGWESCMPLCWIIHETGCTSVPARADVNAHQRLCVRMTAHWWLRVISW